MSTMSDFDSSIEEGRIDLAERQQVDPPSGYAFTERDFRLREPPDPLEPAGDEAGHASVHGVTLAAPIREVAGVELQRCPDAEGRQDTLDDSQIEAAGVRTLNSPDGRMGRSRAFRKFALRPADELARFTDDVTNLKPKGAATEFEGLAGHRPIHTGRGFTVPYAEAACFVRLPLWHPAVPAEGDPNGR